MRLQHVMCTVLLALLASCQFSEDRHAKRRIRASELAGTWQATDYAIKSLRDVGHTAHLSRADHEMTLRSDGSCSIKTVFNLQLFSGPDPAYRVYDSGCRWELRSPRDLESQQLGLELIPAPPNGQPYYYFAEEDGRLLLWFYASDPDAWRYMEFERINGGA